MMKKITIASTIIILILVVVLIFSHFKNLKPFDSSLLYNSISSASSVIIEYEDIESVSAQTNKYGTLLNSIAINDWLETWVAFFDTLKTNDNPFEISQKNIFNRPFYQSLNSINDSIFTVFHFPLLNQSEVNFVRKFLLSNSPTCTIESVLNFNDIKISNCLYNKLYKKFSVAIYNGVMLISDKPKSIIGLINQLSTVPNILQEPVFISLQKTSSNLAPIHLYLNLSKINTLYKGCLNENNPISSNFIKSLGDWVELDVNLSASNILLNGFIAQKNSFIDTLFNEIKPTNSRLTELFPSQTNFFILYNFGNEKDVALSNFKLTFPSDSVTNKSLNPFWGNEMALLNLEQNHQVNNNLLIIKTESQTNSWDQISKLIDPKTIIKPHKIYKPDADIQFPIYNIQALNSYLQPLNKLFPFVPHKYLAYYKNYMIISDSTEFIDSFLYSNLLNNNIHTSPPFIDYLKNVQVNDNIHVFLSSHYITSFIKPHLNSESIITLEKAKSKIHDFYGIGIQLTHQSQSLYSNLLIQYSPNSSSQPKTIWQSKLDTMVYMKPLFIENHINGETEIFVQDVNNTLYLINNSGRILWKKPIEATIIGEPVQIDFYNNGKYQYAFNTAQKIHIIDRNGNYVENYPIKFPTPATNSISIFDYDNNKAYRFFVALSNNKILVTNKHGKRLPDWVFNETESRVIQPIKYVSEAGKDYIIVVDSLNIYIVNRKGITRTKPQSLVAVSCSSGVYPLFGDGRTAKLVFFNENNSLQYMTVSDGQIHETSIVLNEKPIFFKPIDSQSNTFAYLTSNTLGLIRNDEIVWKNSFQNSLNTSIDIYNFSLNTQKIGVYDKNNKIYLFNIDGSTYAGFPLTGTSRYSIGFLSPNSTEFNLIVGGLNNFIYNYRVK